MQAQASGAQSRRARVRAATSQEIIQTARQLLLSEGSAGLSLRAIAREMGMTAPAIYRYFDSHEALIHNVVADIFTELSDFVEAAVSQARAASSMGTPGQPDGSGHQGTSGHAGGPGHPGGPGHAGDPEHPGGPGHTAGLGHPGGPGYADTDLTAVSLIAACQAFRGWSVEHPADFGLLFGSPLPGVDLSREDPLMECGLRFGAIFLRLFADLWQLKPFPVPADDDIDPVLLAQLGRYRDQIGTGLPLGALQKFLLCWVQLYGTVCLEVFGHLRFALEDSRGMFELMLTDLAGALGLRYPLAD